MAANMIGMNKRIIVFDAEGAYMTMFNPEIIKHKIAILKFPLNACDIPNTALTTPKYVSITDAL